MMAKLDGVDIFVKKMEMEEEGFEPEGLDMGRPIVTLEDDSKSPFHSLTEFMIKLHWPPITVA